MVFEWKLLIASRLATWYGQEVLGSAGLWENLGALRSSSMAENRDPDTAMT